MSQWDETCSVCLNNNPALWWHSRSGYWVCRVCATDALAALEVLARRKSTAAVEAVKRWRQSIEQELHP